MKKIALLLYTVIVLVLAASCDRRAEYLTASGAMLGTTFQATGDITDCTAHLKISRKNRNSTGPLCKSTPKPRLRCRFSTPPPC